MIWSDKAVEVRPGTFREPCGCESFDDGSLGQYGNTCEAHKSDTQREWAREKKRIAEKEVLSAEKRLKGYKRNGGRLKTNVSRDEDGYGFVPPRCNILDARFSVGKGEETWVVEIWGCAERAQGGLEIIDKDMIDFVIRAVRFGEKDGWEPPDHCCGKMPSYFIPAWRSSQKYGDGSELREIFLNVLKKKDLGVVGGAVLSKMCEEGAS